MKRIKLLIITFITSLVVTGCWDSAEINKREFIFAVGIDKNPDNLKFTSEIPKINEGSEEERLVYTKDSTNFADFYATSYLHSEKAISDRLMQVIVLGEDVARDSETVKKLFDEIQRSPQMNRRVKICISKGKAEEIINMEIPSNPIVGRFLSDMLIKLKRESFQDIYTFDEAILHLGQTGNAMVPVVEINDKSLKVERAAVVKEYELVGFLEPMEVETIMLLLNPNRANIRNFNITVDDVTVGLGAVDVSMTEELNLSGNKLTADYFITLYCYIDSFIMGDDRLEDKSFMNKIKEQAAKQITDISQNTINKLQHTYRADLLRLKDDLYKYHKGEFDQIEDKYDEVFEDADINVHINVDIKSTGLVK